MAAVASQPPVRTPSGGTTDQVFQPLADCGNGNFAFYHTFFDDFDQSGAATQAGVANFYTVTATGTGMSIAGTAGDGGLLLFTSSTTTTGGIVSIQLPKASYTINSQPKKVFFETRLKMNQFTSITSVIAGLIQTTATPATVTDGVYFSFSSATNLTINSAVGSAITSVSIPLAAYNLAANTNIDLAFYITRLGDVLAYVDSQLVGFIPQSNIGTTGNPQNAGAVARITAPTLTTAVLNPTLALTTSAASTTVMTADFMQVSKER